jgi:myo-inositol-1(or 4)-monophosphatase
MSKYQKELEIAKKAVQEAGAIVKEKFFGSFDVFVKDDRSYVTSADLEAEKKIIEIINDTFPDHKITSEEVGGNGKESKFSWVIDPIDGTTNFSKKVPFFNIALAMEVDGQVVLGAVFQPITQELFWAEKGEGAFLNGNAISVDRDTEFKDSFFGYCHGSNLDDIKYMIDMMKEVKPNSREFRKFGSADLELCYVACGRLNGFVAKGVKLMDFKPGCIIAEEAGAVITDFEDGDWQGNTDGDVLTASSRDIHRNLLDVINKAS